MKTERPHVIVYTSAPASAYILAAPTYVYAYLALSHIVIPSFLLVPCLVDHGTINIVSEGRCRHLFSATMQYICAQLTHAG